MSDWSKDHLGKGAFVATVVGLLVLLACGDDKNGPKTGSNSNWLVACTEATDCSDTGACLCGACSRTCSDDDQCGDLADARCGLSNQPAAGSLCGGEPVGTGLCLPRCMPGSCPLGQSCADGGCVLAELPSTEFCAAVREPVPAERIREDELLDLLQRRRAFGELECDGAGLAPAPVLRLDGRLRCAARVKALDQALTGTSGPVDSAGRDAPQRLALAGYASSSWWESYAFDTASAVAAFDLLVSDLGSCPELGSPEYSAVGIGNAGEVFVITLASE